MQQPHLGSSVSRSRTPAPSGNAPIAARPCECKSPELLALFASLDRYQDRIPLEVLRAGLDSLDVEVGDVASACCFAEDRYVRNRLHMGPSYEALLVCWRPGQESPIHDHAGSSCAFRVLGGDADEVIFDFASKDAVSPASARRMPEGFVCAAQDADIHQVQNHRSGADLVTLHIYSPALTRMHVYTPAD